MSLVISVDGLSLPLLSVLFVVLLVSLITRPSNPLPVHPFLFGKQALFEKIRRKNETPILSANVSSYYSTNASQDTKPSSIRSILSSLPIEKFSITGVPQEECNFQALANGVKALVPGFGANGRMIGIWTGEHEGAVHLVSLLTSLSLPSSPTILSLPAPLPPSFPLSKLASLSILFLTSSTYPLLHSALQSAPINPPSAKPIIVWVGKGSEAVEKLDGKDGFKVLGLTELLEAGKKVTPSVEEEKVEGGEIVRLIVQSGGKVVKQTHSNVLGSLLALRSLYPTTPSASASPLAKPLHSFDRILSFSDPSTPYGLSVTLAGFLSTGHFKFVSGDMLQDKVWKEIVEYKPTVVFGPAGALHGLAFQLTNETRMNHSVLGNIALSIKMSNLRKGHIAKDGLGDKLAFQDIRSRTGLESIRTIFVDGIVSQLLVDSLRSILGCPVVSILTHPELSIPICATQLWDFQYLPSHSTHSKIAKDGELPELTHSGPPIKGVEIKLVDVEEKESKKKVLRGKIVARSSLFPAVIDASSLSDSDYVDLGASGSQTPTNSPSESQIPPSWFETGIVAELRRNGTIKQIA